MGAIQLEIVRATEAAAIAAARQVGRGDKRAADRDATQALRISLGRMDFLGQVVIGEGEKDNAPGLFAGEVVGRRTDPRKIRRRRKSGLIENSAILDLAVDPIDGTTQTARGGTDAVSVLACGPQGSLFATRHFYVKKIAVGPVIFRGLGGFHEDWLTAPPEQLVRALAAAAGKDVSELTVAILDRPRHERLIFDLRRLGCRVRLKDCDVAAAVATGLSGYGMDVCLGIGGAPEGVLCAAALKCLGGGFQAMLVDPEGKPTDGRLLRMNDLVRAEVTFAATGITDGCLLRRVRFQGATAITHSLAMSSADGSVRWCETRHPLEQAM
jgi:fructose-1,6-bisphosphatase II